jgi:4-hydroxybenzoate polyprenyltransferase
MSLGADIEVLRPPRAGLFEWLEALRLHQWLTNLLIFVPLLAAHRVTDLELFSQGILAFLFFGLCASSTYLLNALLDLPDDRQQLVKRTRAFASGRI